MLCNSLCLNWTTREIESGFIRWVRMPLKSFFVWILKVFRDCYGISKMRQSQRLMHHASRIAPHDFDIGMLCRLLRQMHFQEDGNDAELIISWESSSPPFFLLNRMEAMSLSNTTIDIIVPTIGMRLERLSTWLSWGIDLNYQMRMIHANRMIWPCRTEFRRDKYESSFPL